MSDTDLEEQKYELLALKEINGEETIKVYVKDSGKIEDLEFAENNSEFFKQFRCKSNCKIGGRLSVAANLNDPLKIFWTGQKSEEHEFDIQYMPPILIEFAHPKDYPSKSCPEFRICCDWLTGSQIDSLRRKFQDIWTENYSCVILFIWISVIKDELLEVLDINHNAFNIDELVKFDTASASPVEEETKMVTTKHEFGIVQDFDRKKGFGFIQPDSGESRLFFHIKQSNLSKIEIKPKLAVSYSKEISERNGKLQAVNVSKQSVTNHEEMKVINPVDQELNKNDIEEDPKIVKLLKSYNESQEIEAFNSRVFECIICFAEKLGKNCLQFAECQHVFCNECMRSHFDVKISQGEMTSLTCPEAKCTSQALPTQVKALVSDKNFQLYEKVLLSTTLESMADIVLCPRRHCQCPTIIDREANMGQCANCTFVFCIYCKASFHGVAPCRMKSKEQRALLTEYMGADESEKALLEKRYGKRQLTTMVETFMSETYLTDNTKQCPKCRAPIQKSEGCNKMTCNKCGTHFCYLCGNKLPNINPYSHFSLTGGECFNQLFEGVEDLDEEFDFVFDDEDSEEEENIEEIMMRIANVENI